MAAEQLHEGVTDPTIANFLFPRWVEQIRNKILSHASWNWNKDQMDLTWPAAAAGAEVSVLYLPSYIDRIFTAFPGSTTGIGAVRIITATEVDMARPIAGRDRGQDCLVQHGYYGVENDMPGAGLVNVAATGVTGQLCLIEGMDVNDRDQREEVVVPGAGNVNTVGVYRAGVGGVRRITLTGDGTGTPITTSGIVTATSGGVTLISLNSFYETAKDHRRTELYGTVSGTSTKTVRYWRKHFPFTTDSDIIDLPDVFDDLMELGVMMRLAQLRMARTQDASELTVLRGEWNERLQELRAWDKRDPGKKYSMRPRRQWGRR